MEANFDILISGCNTRCLHCYVNGGPGPNMPLRDALLCLRRLDELAALLPFPASFTLDNEPFNHPDAAEIIRAASDTKHIAHYHHGMTTGVALMARKDKAAALQAYLDCGYTDFGVTLHGGPAHHDIITRRKGSFQTSIEAAEFMKSRGAELSVSLMLNRFFPEDAEEIDRVLDRLRPGFVYFAIPNFTPHANMPAFEPYRADIGDLRALSPRLARWQQDETELLRQAEQGTVSAAVRLLEDVSLADLFAQPQNELYLAVHPDCRLFLGNTGVETTCLGDLRSLDLEVAAEAIRSASGNRDYGAFYDPDRLPGQDAVIRALKRLPGGLLYSEAASAIYRALSDLNTPTRILPGPFSEQKRDCP